MSPPSVHRMATFIDGDGKKKNERKRKKKSITFEQTEILGEKRNFIHFLGVGVIEAYIDIREGSVGKNVFPKLRLGF